MRATKESKETKELLAPDGFCALVEWVLYEPIDYVEASLTKTPLHVSSSLVVCFVAPNKPVRGFFLVRESRNQWFMNRETMEADIKNSKTLAQLLNCASESGVKCCVDDASDPKNWKQLSLQDYSDWSLALASCKVLVRALYCPETGGIVHVSEEEQADQLRKMFPQRSGFDGCCTLV